MWDSIVLGLSSFGAGIGFIATAKGFSSLVMLIIGGVLLYLGAKKDVEPLLLLPIGFGCFLVNLPLTEVMQEHGVLRFFYDIGISTELFPLLVFMGIGAMTDFAPLLENPQILLLGAAGQFGIFLTLLLALVLGFSKLEAVSIGIIGACDGPTAIYVTQQFAPHLLGAISVAAYSYMSLVPIIQPPIMRLLTTHKERTIKMQITKNTVSQNTKILFPLLVTAVTGIIAPKGLPLMGMIMLGNFLKESGVVARLTKASENEIANIVTLFLGLAIGGTMQGDKFLNNSDVGHIRSGVDGYLPRHRNRCFVREVDVRPVRRKDQSPYRCGGNLCLSHGSESRANRRDEVRQKELPSHARHGSQHRWSDRFRDGCGHNALRAQRNGTGMSYVPGVLVMQRTTGFSCI